MALKWTCELRNNLVGQLTSGDDDNNCGIGDNNKDGNDDKGADGDDADDNDVAGDDDDDNGGDDVALQQWVGSRRQQSDGLA